jgi:hypothetical protein
MTGPAEALFAAVLFDVDAAKELPTGRERTVFALRYILNWLFVSYDTNVKPLRIGRWSKALWIAAWFGKGS